ncbi:MAG: alpha/beta-hydrolase family protein, partial [Acidimicrobiia bacterium]|nr:alpha/beta-hydrolase family protein [Acidimicrobiia bacterium]
MKAGAVVGKTAVWAAGRFNPITNSPSAPLKTRALFGSFGPSLMPRAAMHQGMAAGMSILAADLVMSAVDGAVRRMVPGSAPFAMRIGARALVSAAGLAVSKIPETDDETTLRASIRSAGRLAAAGGVGGMIYETSIGAKERFPAKSPMRPVIVSAAGFAAAAVYSRNLLAERQSVIKRWTEDDKPATLAASLSIGFTVATVGRGIGRGFLASRRGMAEYVGDDFTRAQIGRLINTAVWAAGGVSLYYAGVGYIARSNEKIEPAYSRPPVGEFVSGGPKSISAFSEVGLQGRRFLTDVVTPDLIESTLGEKAKAHPIRAFVGVNSEPLYPSGRSEMMLDELERLGAFDRKYLLLVSPTGTGWVDQTMIESVEILTRGDIATACIQYGRGPSFLEVQKVHLGRTQFRGLLWGVRQRLLGLPEEKRPKVLVFGESLGAWSSSDVVMHQGIAGFDHYGIDHALWFGLPGLAKWSKTGMRQGSSDLVPAGTVEAFDNFGEYKDLSAEHRKKLRAVIVDHDNDPIAQMSFRWAVKRPPWLDGTERGRDVPEGMQWYPLITFVQVMVVAMNAMRTVPGEFKSFGHDYRGDTAHFVHAAYQLDDVTDEQMEAVVDTLRQLELERGERIKTAKAQATEAGDTVKR